MAAVSAASSGGASKRKAVEMGTGEGAAADSGAALKNKGARRYCFTANLNPDWLYDNYTRICEEETNNIRFLCFQKEAGEETKREHIQGYIELHKPAKVTTIQNYFGGLGKFHVEICAGTAKQNIDYCTKVKGRVRDPVMWGTQADPGRRTDLEALARRVIEGVPIKEIAEDSPAQVVRNFRGLKELEGMFNQPKPRTSVTIYYLVGDPGCGKSYVARNLARFEFADDVYECQETEQGWFDGYAGQSVVMFDDFCGKFPLQMMLKLLDYGALRLPVKGGFVNIKADTFIFTSNFHPKEVYANHRHETAWLSRLNGTRYSSVEVIEQEQVESMFADMLAAQEEGTAEGAKEEEQEFKRLTLKRSDAAPAATLKEMVKEVIDLTKDSQETVEYADTGRDPAMAAAGLE